MELFDLVKTLTELTGPTGHEEDVQDWLRRRWASLGLEVSQTPIGNLVARLGGSGRKVVLGAHADEISFRVKSIDADGFIWLTAGRGRAEERPPDPVPLGHRASIVTPSGVLEGTFVTITGHVMTREQRSCREERPISWLDFYVDVGARSRAEVESLGVHAGCPVVCLVETRRNGSNIVGKAMDDRAGLAVLTALASVVDRALLRYEVWFASTVMEEMGLIGARSVAPGFDVGIVLEVGLAGDIPLVDKREMPVALGRGPIVVHQDSAVAYSRRLTLALADCAATAGVAVQHAVFQNFSSDGREWVQEGVPTAMVAFPCRHTHSPYETVDEQDLMRTVDLLRSFLTTG